jgi:hypothetical protein
MRRPLDVRALLVVLAFLLSGCGAAYYGAIAAIIATQKKTTTTITSFPDSVPTDDLVPPFGTLVLSADQISVDRTTTDQTGTTTTTLKDFQVTGIDFPSGFGEARSNRDTDTTLVAGDKLFLRVNGDTPQAISFGSGDTATVGTQVAATIQAKVNLLAPLGPTVPKEAYTLFVAQYDPSTRSYRFVSGSPGPSSEVVFQPDPRPDTADPKLDDASNVTAGRLGFGTANGGIETAGANAIGITLLNRGTDRIPSGTSVDLYLSHDKVLDKTKDIRFDQIVTDVDVQVGEARRFFRKNGTQTADVQLNSDKVLRGDITSGNWYVIFDVQSANGEKITDNNTIPSRSPLEIYQPVNDPAATTPGTVNDLDFVITKTSSQIGLVEGKFMSTSVSVTNYGAPVGAGGVDMDIDVVLSQDLSFDEPAAIRDKAGKIPGVRINTTDPNRPITVVLDSGGTQAIHASPAAAGVVTVTYNGSASGPDVATVQSLIQALNDASFRPVDAFSDEVAGDPTKFSLNSLVAASGLTGKPTVVAKDIFVATKRVNFGQTAQPNQTQSFSVSGLLRSQAILSVLLPTKLTPLFRIKPILTGGAPENAKNDVRQAANFVRIYDPAHAVLDSNTGALLPSVSSDDFARLEAVTQRPVNTGAIRQGQQRVFAFELPDTGLASLESQLLVILHTQFDSHLDLLNSNGDFLDGRDDSPLGLIPILYTALQASETNRTFYLVVSAQRPDESDLGGGSETFDLTISVNSREPGDLGLAQAVDGGNQLQNIKERFEPPAAAPRIENNVLIPFSLTNGKAEVVVVIPQRARVKFHTSPVFRVGVNTIITEFAAGAVPKPVEFQAQLDSTLNRITYDPKGGDVNSSHILNGVYTLAFESLQGLPDTQNFRLEIETQYLSDQTTQ